MVRRAECACRACSVEMGGEPVLNGICHCANCKRRTGSAFGWSVYFPDETIRSTSGPLKAYALAPEWKQTRWFCESCGTTLYWKSGFFPAQTGIAGGCFIDPPVQEPDLTVSNDQRLCWVGLPDRWATSIVPRASNP